MKTQEQIQTELHNKYPFIDIISPYSGANNKVKLKCNKCGHTWLTTARSVIASAGGCPKCGVKAAYANKAEQRLKNLLNLDKFEYLNEYKYSEISKCYLYKVKCKNCGNIRYTNSSNLVRFGCKHCSMIKAGNLTRKSKEEFVKNASFIHNNFYDYSKVNYINGKTKVTIICPIHGDFQMTPLKHIYQQQGCPICKGSGLEKITNSVLNNFKIPFEKQKYIFYEGKRMFVDFVINYNKQTWFIETNGEQHYKEIKGGWKNYKGLIEQQKRDNLLEKYCKKNNIHLIWIKYDEIIKTRVEEIIKEITAVPKEKSLELLSIKNGEGWDANPVVNTEVKMSVSPYSVETEPKKLE